MRKCFQGIDTVTHDCARSRLNAGQYCSYYDRRLQWMRLFKKYEISICTAISFIRPINTTGQYGCTADHIIQLKALQPSRGGHTKQNLPYITAQIQVVNMLIRLYFTLTHMVLSDWPPRLSTAWIDPYPKTMFERHFKSYSLSLLNHSF